MKTEREGINPAVKPSGSPKGFGRSPTITFPGAVNTLTPGVLDVMAVFTRGLS